MKSIITSALLFLAFSPLAQAHHGLNHHNSERTKKTTHEPTKVQPQNCGHKQKTKKSTSIERIKNDWPLIGKIY
ncbi:MAG: hypothetical protein ACI9J4_000842 [Paraglaciecola sp.]|jgi:hypothetical protein